MGYFNDTTVEIIFNGEKIRVSPDVAKAIESSTKKKEVKKETKSK
jgi:hypothetical protein